MQTGKLRKQIHENSMVQRQATPIMHVRGLSLRTGWLPRLQQGRMRHGGFSVSVVILANLGGRTHVALIFPYPLDEVIVDLFETSCFGRSLGGNLGNFRFRINYRYGSLRGSGGHMPKLIHALTGRDVNSAVLWHWGSRVICAGWASAC